MYMHYSRHRLVYDICSNAWRFWVPELLSNPPLLPHSGIIIIQHANIKQDLFSAMYSGLCHDLLHFVNIQNKLAIPCNEEKWGFSKYCQIAMSDDLDLNLVLYFLLCQLWSNRVSEM